MNFLEKLYNTTLEFTDKQIDNVINIWELEGDKDLQTFSSLIILGDSKQIAFASTMVKKYKGDNSEFYINAYTK